MNTSLKCAVLVAIGFSTASVSNADFRDFKMTGVGTDSQWSTLANWEESAFPTSADSARIEKDCYVANGVTGEALKLSVAGFSSDVSMFVEAGGILTAGTGGVEIAYSRKNGVLDVSGTLNSTGDIKMGLSTTYSANGTLIVRNGGVVTGANLIAGASTTGGSFIVDQLGGNITLTGAVTLADVEGSTASASYTISGGVLSATRLNMGGTGTTEATFTVSGSSAQVNFSSTSWISGDSTIAFILDAAGVSAVTMDGGYTLASTATLIVDASLYEGNIGSGVLLIDVNEGDELATFENLNITAGYSLDYRAGDGLYLVPEPAETVTYMMGVTLLGLLFYRSRRQR